MTLDELPLTLTIEQAAKLLGVSRGLAYTAAKSGELPTLKLGRRLLVPRARLLELIGETAPESNVPAFTGKGTFENIDNANSSP